MKRLLIAVIFSLAVSGTAFARSLDFKGIEHFQQTFPQATDIKCKVTTKFTEVDFTWNGLKLQAFYDTEGNYLATSRPLLASELPLAIQISLKRKHPDGILAEAVEFNDSNGQATYVLTVNSIKKNYQLRYTADGDESILRKTKVY